MNKNRQKQKGFSLIELIVVIAVIAAIAAVIVPSITNFSGQAEIAADERSTQLWNTTYANAVAAGATGLPTLPVADANNLPVIAASYDPDGAGPMGAINFNAPAVTLQATLVNVATTNVGVTLKAAP